MKLNIIGAKELGFEFNELNKNANGGTELMMKWIKARINPELWDKFQIIPSRVRNIDPDRKAILWLHDLPNDPESQHLKDPESRKRFAKIVCVSNWQCQLYNAVLGIPFGEMTVIQNAVEPIPEHDKPDDGIIRLIYHTTPHRGLGLLVPAFEMLAKTHPNVELDIYSSFNVYGWAERDKEFEPLFERARQHEQIRYHGAVSNAEVREALTKAHVFAYPCIWPETSCIAAIEALSAGCAVVCPNLAALPETTANWAWLYQFHEDPNYHAGRFAQNLSNAIRVLTDDRKAVDVMLNSQSSYFHHFYDIDRRAKQWESLLQSLT